MQKIETGSPFIHRFDDALDPLLCRGLSDMLRERTDKPALMGQDQALPWHAGDTFSFDHWQDAELRRAIGAYRILVAQLICLCQREAVYPHFTDLVRWRPGKAMAEHKDDGYPGDDPLLGCRHYSAVTYCNDDFEGGETFIRNGQGGHYVSRPKMGSLVFYPSDERAAHGVRPVIGKDRVTLSTWFTRDPSHYRP